MRFSKSDPSRNVMRTCVKCGEVKGIQAFAVSVTCKDGYRLKCKQCCVKPKAYDAYGRYLCKL